MRELKGGLRKGLFLQFCVMESGEGVLKRNGTGPPEGYPHMARGLEVRMVNT